MMNSGKIVYKTVILTILALIAFAANSVLCRLALGEQVIDAAGFTSIRLFSGALVLFLILKLTGKKNNGKGKGSWKGALALFAYASTFSFAYLSLKTGTGALILFAAVQITIIVLSLFAGNRLHISEWLGILIAFAGFVYLVSPGISAPSPGGFAFMTIAGIAWGVYTLNGRQAGHPLSDTTYNFIRTLPFVVILAVLSLQNSHLSARGIWLAVLSGSVMSGIGYTIWYSALAGLSDTQAAVVQLSVPVIAALGGVLFVAEPISWRLTISGLLILSGILLVILGRSYLAGMAQNSPRAQR